MRTYEQIVAQIEDAVLNGDLRAGSRLPSERDLMAQFEVSRSTVREALRVLQSDGLVRSRQGDPHGPEVLPLSTDGVHRSLNRLLRTERLDLVELIQFRMFVEAAENHLAAQLRTDAQLDDMSASIQRMEQAVSEGYDAFSRADVEFHDAVASAAGNRLLQVCNQVVRAVVLDLVEDKIARSPDSAATMRDSIRRHADVLEAIRAGDGAAAAALARQHLYEYYAAYLPGEHRQALGSLVAEGWA